MKKDRKEEINNIVEFIITNYNYGDVINYKTLERVMGIDITDVAFSYNMAMVKKELIEYGCIITTVFNEGYKILFPNEVAKEVCRKYAKAGVRKFACGLKIMEHIDQGMLTEEEKAQFLEMEKIVSEMYRTSENSLLTAQFLIGDIKRRELKK